MFKRSRPFLDGSSVAAGDGRANVVRLPPGRELRALPPQASEARRRPDRPPRSWWRGIGRPRVFLLVPARADTRRVAGLVRMMMRMCDPPRQAAEGEDLFAALFQRHVQRRPDVGRLVEALDDAPDRLRHGLAHEGAAAGCGGAQMGMLDLLSRSARASASTVVTDGLTDALFQRMPIDANAGGSATSSRRSPGVVAAAGRKPSGARRQSLPARAQEIAQFVAAAVGQGGTHDPG